MRRRLKQPRRLTATSLVLVASLWAAATYAAEVWKPSGPIHLIVPYPAGGGTDIMARVVGREISKSFGEPVVIDNKPGAGGLVGSTFVARSRPNGLTLCVCNGASLSLAGLVGSKPSYDPENDLLPVSGGWRATLLLTTRADLPVANVAELVAYAKANPGKLRYGTSGFGTPTDLGGQLFRSLAQIDWTVVPFQGEADAINALASGVIDVYAPTVTSSAPGLVKDGRLKAIATFSSGRSPQFPDLPTIADQGFPAFSADSYFGFNVARGTPAATIASLSAAIQAALLSADAKVVIAQAGVIPIGSDPPTYGKLIFDDRQKWQGLLPPQGTKPP